MPDSLPALESERSRILRQISTLGDLRPGSICAVVRRCGKPTCHCAKPNDPGHDPQLRLSRTVKGKTVAESFSSPAAFQKAQAEVREYQRLQKMCAELVDVNQRICRLRPLRKTREVERGGKKTAAAIHQEITRELDTLLPRIFAERRKAGDLDLEAVELGVSHRAPLRRCSGSERTSPAIRTDSDHGALRVRQSRSLQGHAAQTDPHRAGSGSHAPRLLLVLPLPARAVPRR